jgi:hypothetical protein
LTGKRYPAGSVAYLWHFGNGYVPVTNSPDLISDPAIFVSDLQNDS